MKKKKNGLKNKRWIAVATKTRAILRSLGNAFHTGFSSFNRCFSAAKSRVSFARESILRDRRPIRPRKRLTYWYLPIRASVRRFSGQAILRRGRKVCGRGYRRVRLGFARRAQTIHGALARATTTIIITIIITFIEAIIARAHRKRQF